MSNSPRTLGKYELRERLGKGGMAEVWKAFDPQLERFVAIKYLQANLRTDPTFGPRFIREARAVASLRHSNIIRIYDFDTATSPEDPDESIAYMVMDYIEGQTLADYIRSTSAVRKFPSTSEIVHLFMPICSAIAYAHKHGIIHRDIKPANILLDKHNTAHNLMGEPILSDFGIVKMMGSATGTLTSSSVGTPLYISPEQARGQPSNEASDIYSLGVTLFEACTGQPPFQGESPFAIIHQHIMTPPPSPRSINPALSEELEAVILCCLAKDPQERYTNAADLETALKNALEQSVASIDTMNEATVYKPERKEIQSAPVATNDHREEQPPDEQVDIPTVITAPPQEASLTPRPSRAAGVTPPPTPAQVASTPVPPAVVTEPRRQHRGLFMGLIALLILVVVGSVLGTFFLFNNHQQQNPVQAATIVGQGFFSSSGQSSGPSTQGINDTFQLRLSNVPAPAAGKSYYAWLLPDTIQSEASALSLGTLSIASGTASLSTPYMDPQHNNLLATYSRVLVTEESTSPPPQSYSLDKTTWRYYAEIPQMPASRDCNSSLNQLSDLCHVRHLLAVDPEVQQVGLSGGLNYWFLNNVEEVQKWAREAVDHGGAIDIRHKAVDILYMLDSIKCVQLDLQKAAPGTDNTPDDANLSKTAAIALLNCSLTPTQPGYLSHIHNHLNAIIQSPGVLADQSKLATQIVTELNTTNNLLNQLHTDALKLVMMTDAQLTQPAGLAMRTGMDSLATRILSGGTDPATGTAETGVAQISDQMQQLAILYIATYTSH
ncbi:MAG TPA: protein kinase [Ktedonobacteraceae bacterium]|nr:protein kinase [Ktedonobacteraceae bacterium]